MLVSLTPEEWINVLYELRVCLWGSITVAGPQPLWAVEAICRRRAWALDLLHGQGPTVWLLCRPYMICQLNFFITLATRSFRLWCSRSQPMDPTITKSTAPCIRKTGVCILSAINVSYAQNMLICAQSTESTLSTKLCMHNWVEIIHGLLIVLNFA